MWLSREGELGLAGAKEIPADHLSPNKALMNFEYILLTDRERGGLKLREQ